MTLLLPPSPFSLPTFLRRIESSDAFITPVTFFSAELSAANYARRAVQNGSLPVINGLCFIAGTPFMKPEVSKAAGSVSCVLTSWHYAACSIAVVGTTGFLVAQWQHRKAIEKENRRARFASIDLLFASGGF